MYSKTLWPDINYEQFLRVYSYMLDNKLTEYDIRQKTLRTRMTLKEFFKERNEVYLNEEEFISSLGIKSEEYLLKASKLLKVGSARWPFKSRLWSLEFLDYRKLLKRILMMRLRSCNWPLRLFSMEPYR